MASPMQNYLSSLERFIILFYYISKLVCVLWLVNLAVRTLLHRLLKLKVFLLPPNCFVIYRQIFSTYIANKSLKLSFTLNCVLKRANDLKTISNWFVLLSTCFRNLKPFLKNGKFPKLFRHTIDWINILLTLKSRGHLEIVGESILGRSRISSESQGYLALFFLGVLKNHVDTWSFS